MIKIIFFIIFIFLIINLIERKLVQIFNQNLNFLILLIFLIEFPFNNLNIWIKIYYFMGCDFYSMIIILLRFWIFSIILIVNRKNLLKFNYLLYLIILNFIIILLIYCFLIINLIIFYIFFESRLIPVFILIIGWGGQIDRIQAGFYIILYTLFGSLPLFIIILIIYQINFSIIIDLININLINFIFYFLIIIALLIKIPIYFVHLWLPKAHVEAPLVGSIILAGIILKLGRYGLMRFILIIINIRIYFNKFMIVIRLVGGVYSRLICLCQIDIKLLVAYSSVVHIRILMSRIITIFNWGYNGGVIIMIAHGLCSSGLFCLVNINYERLGSRSLLINKGIINLFPSLRLIWFLLCSSNLSFPPSLNLFREIIILNSLISWNFNLIIILIILLFFRASYTLYFYSYRQHGIPIIISYLKGVTINEFLILILHWVPLNLIFVYIYIYI